MKKSNKANLTVSIDKAEIGLESSQEKSLEEVKLLEKQKSNKINFLKTL